MATAALPSLPLHHARLRSVRKHLKTVADGVRKHYRVSVKPVAVQLASIPFTLAGTACIDVGVFSANTIAGWIVTGISLILLEHITAQDD